MSILVDRNTTKVICQGFTGRNGNHTRLASLHGST